MDWTSGPHPDIRPASDIIFRGGCFFKRQKRGRLVFHPKKLFRGATVEWTDRVAWTGSVVIDRNAVDFRGKNHVRQAAQQRTLRCCRGGGGNEISDERIIHSADCCCEFSADCCSYSLPVPVASREALRAARLLQVDRSCARGPPDIDEKVCFLSNAL